MNRKYDVILFDMDGTTANTDEIVLQTYIELFSLYGNGRKVSKEKIYTFSGPPLSQTLKNEFPHLDYQFIFDEYIRISTPKYYQILTAYDGEFETLKWLKSQGFKLGIVTNKRHYLSIECLKILHLENIFDVVIGFDDVSSAKPDKEGIIKASKMLGCDNFDKILYVGDNDIDYETAHNAGVDCCLVTWGPRQINKALRVRYFIDHFAQIKEIVYE